MNSPDDLAARMARIAHSESPMPLVQPRPAYTRYPRQLRLTLSEEAYQALHAAKAEDGIEVVMRLRALVETWRTDTRLQAKVRKAARGVL
jgi:hypothetical protein